MHSKFKDEQEYNDKLTKLKLDHPYRLAIELFVEYVKFRNNSKLGVQYASGIYNQNDYNYYETNIRDLFTDEDLVRLGGNYFIKDCLAAVNVLEENVKPQYISYLPDFFNVNPGLQSEVTNKPSVVTKTDLIRAVDNHMSWSIFKSEGKKLKLTDDEEVLFRYAVGRESFWKKHLWLGELKTLLFTGSAALLLGLVGGLAFGITGAPLALLILTPIGAGAVFIAPLVGHTSRVKAITNIMEQESEKNTKYNNAWDDQVKYLKYKQKPENDFSNFLQQEKKKITEGIKKKDNIIKTDSPQNNS